MTKARENSDYTGLQGDLALKSPVASPVFTGNVGIGTSSPTGNLDVTGTANSTVSITAAGSGNDSLLNFVQGSSIEGGITYDHNPSYLQEKMIFRAGNNTPQVTITGDGNVLFGGMTGLGSTSGFNFQNSSGYGRLNLKKTISDTVIAVNFYHNNSVVGSIKYSNTATQYVTSSDYRLKENVVPMSGATAAVKLLKPCNFDWIQDGSNVNGFLAHELAEVVPEAVTGTKDAMMDEEYEVTAATDTETAVMGTRSVPDMQGIDQSKLVPLLTATIQELIARIEALEA